MTASDIEVGDYVFATKYGDGGPRDHFCVGFVIAEVGMWRPNDQRWSVVDGDGRLFRGNGFRRVRRISRETGSAMCAVMREDDPEANLCAPGCCMWDVLDDIEAGRYQPAPV